MKKTTVNNRRKKLPLLLGALLIISVAAYGTRAYFSDSATQQADIQLSLGNLDIKSVDSTWKYTPVGNNVNNVLLGVGTVVEYNMVIDSENAKKITNVQPGDQFERIFEFKNNGSLEQTVEVDNKVSSVETSIFKVDFKQLNEAGSELTSVGPANIISGKSVKYKMTISVKTTEGFNASHNTEATKTVATDTVFNAIGNSPDSNLSAEKLLENAVTVKATQVNAQSN